MKKQLFSIICAAILTLSGCGKQALDSSGTVQDFLAENQTASPVSNNTETPETSTTAPSPESTKSPEASTPIPENNKTPETSTAAPAPEATKVPETDTATAAPIPETTNIPDTAATAPTPEATKAPETTKEPVPESTNESENVSTPEESDQSQETESTSEPPAETSNPAPAETPEAPTEQPPAEETPAPAEETQPPAPTEAPAVCNHSFWQYFEPTCASTYWVEERCEYCGVSNGVRFETGPDLHNYETVILDPGDCSRPGLVSIVCTSCGNVLSESMRAGEEVHDFQPYSGSEIDGEYHVVITYDCDRCTRCGKEINWVQTGCEFIVPEPAATKAPNE